MQIMNVLLKENGKKNSFWIFEVVLDFVVQVKFMVKSIEIVIGSSVLGVGVSKTTQPRLADQLIQALGCFSPALLQRHFFFFLCLLNLNCTILGFKIFLKILRAKNRYYNTKG